MKKRNLRLMALALAVCMSISSVCTAFAANENTNASAAETTAASVSETEPVVTEAPVEEAVTPTPAEDSSEVTDIEVTPTPEVSPDPQPAIIEEPSTVDEILATTDAGTWYKSGTELKCKKVDGTDYTAADGIVNIGGYYYLFDVSGSMRTGAVTFSSSDIVSNKLPVEAGTYYFTDVTVDPVNNDPKDTANFTAGKMVVKNFQKIGNDTFYFDEKGRLKDMNGWLYVDLNDGNGKQYYFLGADDDKTTVAKGVVRIGNWIHRGNNWFYCAEKTGVMVTGWQDINNVRYYFKSGGYMLKNCWKWIDGVCYKFNGSGRTVTGWVQDGKYWYYLEKADVKDSNGNITTRQGAMAINGWKQVNTKWFYLSKYGVMQEKKWIYVGKKWYYLKSGGYMAEGWQKVGSYYYYLKPGNGAMVTGWKKIGSRYFYLRANGSMACNTWIKDGSKYYWLYKGGGMACNEWFTVSGKMYYAGTYGARYKNTFKERNGKGGYFAADGVYTQSWVSINGARRYPGTNGWVANCWKYIDGYKYRFNSNGDLNQDVRGLVSGPYRVETNRARGIVTIYAYDSAKGNYDIPVKAFLTSVGLAATPTPLGTYRATQSLRWQPLMGPSWGQYGTHVTGGIYFHSVAGGARSYYNVNPVSYNMLGSPASHGCMRLCVRDAKWLYYNCNGATVYIFDGATNGPFDRPSNPYMSPSSTIDPTDDRSNPL